MVAPTRSRPAKQVNSESVDFFNGTVGYTGGQTSQRRLYSDYSKKNHVAEDARARELAALIGPNTSYPMIAVHSIAEGD